MSDGNRVELVGLPAAEADLRRWAEQLPEQIAKAADPFTARVADAIRARVPELTGQLAGSVAIDVDDDAPVVGMGAGVVYAGWIEFGGSRGRSYVPEGRYVYPTAEAAADEWAQFAGATAEDTVGRFSWSTPSS